tara:strand:+ start:523 stop:939 length:417 start_codon:yes stop_codon:yes gene_type:complete
MWYNITMINTDDYKEQVTLVDPSRKIEVYRNLHKKCWSVRQAGLVKFHCSVVSLRDCVFVVQPAGHAKVIREKRKNVHAFVRGYISNNCSPAVLDEIYYNPYKAKTFVDFQGNPVHQAEFVELDLKHGEPPVLALNPE